MGHLIADINKQIEAEEICADKLDRLIERHKLCENYCKVPSLNIPEHEAEECCDECEIRKALRGAWNLGYRMGVGSALQVVQK